MVIGVPALIVGLIDSLLSDDDYMKLHAWSQFHSKLSIKGSLVGRR